jgi:hypothetical protein
MVWEKEGGVGFRLLLPFVRVVRFDVAYGQSGSRLNLHIGAYEKAEKQRERIC